MNRFDAYIVGNAVIDLSTICEIYSKSGDYHALMEELYRFIESNDPKEIIVSTNFETEIDISDRIIDKIAKYIGELDVPYIALELQINMVIVVLNWLKMMIAVYP